jgi:hypothetical protein
VPDLAVLLMVIDDKIKAGFDMAGESAKQIIGLATATLGGALALFDDGTRPGLNLPEGTTLFGLAMALLALSVAFGLLTLMAIVGQLSEKTAKPSVYAKGVSLFYFLQMASYGVGLLLLIWFAVF